MALLGVLTPLVLGVRIGVRCRDGTPRPAGVLGVRRTVVAAAAVRNGLGCAVLARGLDLDRVRTLPLRLGVLGVEGGAAATDPSPSWAITVSWISCAARRAEAVMVRAFPAPPATLARRAATDCGTGVAAMVSKLISSSLPGVTSTSATGRSSAVVWLDRCATSPMRPGADITVTPLAAELLVRARDRMSQLRAGALSFVAFVGVAPSSRACKASIAFFRWATSSWRSWFLRRSAASSRRAWFACPWAACSL